MNLESVYSGLALCKEKPVRRSLLCAILLLWGTALPNVQSSLQVTPQTPVHDPRTLVRVTVDELVSNPGHYHDQLVAVVALLRHSDEQDQPSHIYRLRDRAHNQSLRVAYPRGGVSDLRRLVGHRVEIIGTYWDLSRLSYETVRMNEARQPESCWESIDPRVHIFPVGLIRCDLKYDYNLHFVGVQTAYVLEDELPEGEAEAEDRNIESEPELSSSALVDLQALVERPQDYVDRRIGVIGKYRGNNLYGDLDFATKKTPRDFVIKVADTAVWVTGKQAPGLDADKRRDTGRWVKVIGAAWMDEDDVAYLKAEWIGIVPNPGDPRLEPVNVEEEARPEPAAPPPEVLFVMPLDGEKEIPLDTEFLIQFSRDMDPECFSGNVALAYTDNDGPPPELELRYDAPKQTLVVRPKVRLLPQKTLQLVLRRGIRSEDGIPLLSRILSRRATKNLEGASSILAVFTFATQSEI